MVTKEWAAIHRKHHAKCETEEDPHSPQIYGINRVLWAGVFLYVKESYNKETLERYGHGTPEDWMERHEFLSVADFQGQASHHQTLDPASVERAGYIRTLQSWNKHS